VGCPEHDPAGDTEDPADLFSGLSGTHIHPGEHVWRDGEPVFPVEPATCSHPDAGGDKPIPDGPGRDPGYRRDLTACEPMTQVEVGQQRVGDWRTGAGWAPSAGEPLRRYDRC